MRLFFSREGNIELFSHSRFVIILASLYRLWQSLRRDNIPIAGEYQAYPGIPDGIRGGHRSFPAEIRALV